MNGLSFQVSISKQHRLNALASLSTLILVLLLLTEWYDLANLSTAKPTDNPNSVQGQKSELYRSAEQSGGYGIVLGLVLALFVWHPRRVLGLIPWASLLFCCCYLLLYYQISLVITAFFTGLSAGLMAWPLMITLLRQIGLTGPLPPQNITLISILSVFGLGLAYGARIGLTKLPLQQLILMMLAVTAALTIGSWFILPQHALEILLELIFMPMYRFSFHGPGVHQIPVDGPLIVIANHTCMLDPFFLGKIIPRKITPIMTAKYYDKPIIRWFMQNMVGTIRVPISARKTETPELDEAILRLDRGECLVMFPEGKLRREDDIELQYFSQGIWRILKERPETPVIATWIDGGWGSYLSYKNGPPGKGKSLDWFRPIRMVIHSPLVLDSELLATHQATRKYLTELVHSLKQQLQTESSELNQPSTDGASSTEDSVNKTISQS